jgi:Family of unknown function (DUF6931)
MTMTTPQPRGAPRAPLDLAAAAELGDDARALLAPDLSHRAFFQKLVDAGQHAEAVRYLAHALPRREGVWWAWVTAKRAAGPEPQPRIKASLEATERWIAQPTDPNRRTAFERAQEADVGTPAGCAGLAAFLAGDSLAPPNVQAVPPGEFDAAKAITGAIMMAAVVTEPEKAPEKFQAAIQQGLEVVNKIKLWPQG